MLIIFSTFQVLTTTAKTSEHKDESNLGSNENEAGASELLSNCYANCYRVEVIHIGRGLAILAKDDVNIRRLAKIGWPISFDTVDRRREAKKLSGRQASDILDAVTDALWPPGSSLQWSLVGKRSPKFYGRPEFHEKRLEIAAGG